jgi:hypothetical protein
MNWHTPEPTEEEVFIGTILNEEALLFSKKEELQ